MAQSRARFGEVYYQVLYTNKNVSDLSKVPQTNKNIASVLRISSISSGPNPAGGTRILSTSKKLTSEQTDVTRTWRTELKWNGQAWVGNPSERLQELARVLRTSDIRIRAERRIRRGYRHPLLRSLGELQNRRAFWNLAAIDIEAKMFEHAGTPYSGKKRWDLAAVQAIQNRIDGSIHEHRRAISKLAKRGRLGDGFKLPLAMEVRFPTPTGRVTASKLDKSWKSANGIAEPIEEVRILPHRVQVWSAGPGRGRRTYHVTMAHAEAGAFGAFYYVAYCDSDGDGLPDKPIARSPLAHAEEPGRWTAWSFTTEAENVFIGQAWPSADTTIYCRQASGSEWRNLGRQVYSSPSLGKPPGQATGPYVTNCRVYSVAAPLEPTTQPTTKPAGP